MGYGRPYRTGSPKDAGDAERCQGLPRATALGRMDGLGGDEHAGAAATGHYRW